MGILKICLFSFSSCTFNVIVLYFDHFYVWRKINQSISWKFTRKMSHFNWMFMSKNLLQGKTSLHIILDKIVNLLTKHFSLTNKWLNWNSTIPVHRNRNAQFLANFLSKLNDLNLFVFILNQRTPKIRYKNLFIRSKFSTRSTFIVKNANFLYRLNQSKCKTFTGTIEMKSKFTTFIKCCKLNAIFRAVSYWW